MAAAAEANAAATRTLFGADYGDASTDAGLANLVTSYKRKTEYSDVINLPRSLEAVANPANRRTATRMRLFFHNGKTALPMPHSPNRPP